MHERSIRVTATFMRNIFSGRIYWNVVPRMLEMDRIFNKAVFLGLLPCINETEVTYNAICTRTIFVTTQNHRMESKKKKKEKETNLLHSRRWNSFSALVFQNNVSSRFHRNRIQRIGRRNVYQVNHEATYTIVRFSSANNIARVEENAILLDRMLQQFFSITVDHVTGTRLRNASSGRVTSIRGCLIPEVI